jgi:hypothetical protein
MATSNQDSQFVSTPKYCLILVHHDLSAYRLVLSWLRINDHIWNQGDSMTEALMNRIKAQLIRHEGLRLKPYRCTAGKLTIGIGRNLHLE